MKDLIPRQLFDLHLDHGGTFEGSTKPTPTTTSDGTGMKDIKEIERQANELIESLAEENKDYCEGVKVGYLKASERIEQLEAQLVDAEKDYNRTADSLILSMDTVEQLQSQLNEAVDLLGRQIPHQSTDKEVQDFLTKLKNQ